MSFITRLRAASAWVIGRYASHPFRVATTTVKTGLAFHVFWDYFYSWGAAGGPSMLPTFEILGDNLVIDKSYRRGNKVQVGDVVQFSSVVEPGALVIKRVIGLEGDYVMRDTPGSGSQAMFQVCPFVHWESTLVLIAVRSLRAIVGWWVTTLRPRGIPGSLGLCPSP
jgi:hypothetical protein